MADNLTLPKESALTKISDWLQQQQAYQVVKAKWDELDSQKQLTILGSLGLLMGGGLLYFGLTSLYQTWSLGSQLNEKTQLLQYLYAVNDELRSGAGNVTADLSSEPSGFLQMVTSTVGLTPENIEAQPQRPGGSQGSFVENLVDLKLKKVTLRQVFQFAIGVESQAQPAKVRSITIDSQGAEGELTATLSLSIFTGK